MDIRRVKPSDFGLIAGWYAERGLHVPDMASFSDTGFIADDRAAGFVYLTNSNVAMIDALITNPTTVPSLRRESVAKLVGVMIEFAISLGCTNIIALTEHPAVRKLCAQHGFKKTKFECFILSDGEKDEKNLHRQDEDFNEEY